MALALTNNVQILEAMVEDLRFRLRSIHFLLDETDQESLIVYFLALLHLVLYILVSIVRSFLLPSFLPGNELAPMHTHTVLAPMHTHTVLVSRHTHAVLVSRYTHVVLVLKHAHTVLAPKHTDSVLTLRHTDSALAPKHAHKVVYNPLSLDIPANSFLHHL